MESFIKNLCSGKHKSVKTPTAKRNSTSAAGTASRGPTGVVTTPAAKKPCAQLYDAPKASIAKV